MRCLRRSVVRSVVISRKLKPKHDLAELSGYYGTLLGSWHCWFVLPHLDPPPDAPPLGRYSGFKYKICSTSNTASCSTWRQTHSCCQPSATVVTPRVLSTVINWMRPSKPVVNNHRSLCLQHLRRDAIVKQEADQLLFAVTMFLFQ